MIDNALERIESKIAFLEHANSELSDVVYRQQRELDRLQAQLSLMTTQIDALKSQAPEYSTEQERPPHY